MKPILIILVSFCFTLTVLGQQSGVDDSNGFTNKAEAKNLHGNINETDTSFLFHSVRFEKVEQWYNSGNKKTLEIRYYLHFPNNRNYPVDSIYTRWYKNGALAEKSVFTSTNDSVNKKSHTLIYYNDGKINSDYHYKVNVLKGGTAYNWDGRITDSVCKEWYDNGNLKSIKTYSGMLTGKCTEWYDNGRKSFETTYKVIRTEKFDHLTMGGMVGDSLASIYCDNCTYWYEDGKVRLKMFYSKDGIENPGKQLEYYPNGQLKCQGRAYYSNYKEWYDNGIKKTVQYLKNKKQSGRWKTYWSNGKMQYVASYKNGQMNGESKEYYENGKLKSETNYVNGKAGPTKDYDKNGTKIKQ